MRPLRKPRRTLALLIALGLATAVPATAIASTMDGTAAVPVSLEITAGQLHLVSTEPDLSWQNIAPGFTSTVAVSLRNTMSTPAELTIAADDVADHPGTGGTALGNVLQLAATGWHDTLNRVADQPSPNLIVVPANATGNVNIQLWLPGAVDNRAQGASTTFTLNFNTSTGSVGVPVSTSAGFPGGGSGGLLSGLAWTGVAVLATIITGIALLFGGGALLFTGKRLGRTHRG
jgi:hypothetical protein